MINTGGRTCGACVAVGVAVGVAVVAPQRRHSRQDGWGLRSPTKGCTLAAAMPPTGSPDDGHRSLERPPTPAGERPHPSAPAATPSDTAPPAAPPSAAAPSAAAPSGPVVPLRLHLPADPVSSSVARDRLRRWLEVLGWPPAQSEDIVLAVSEAVSNAAEHAYPADPADRERVLEAAGRVDRGVDLYAHASAHAGLRHVTVVVRDHGRWRPPPDDDEFRRRGIPMMRACMDRVAITALEHDDGASAGTRVVLRSRPVPTRADTVPPRAGRVEHYRDPHAPVATRVAPAVFAITRDPAGRLLLVRRADTGNWEPPGGHLEVGETAAAALVREVYEEAGVIVAAGSVAAVISDPEHVLAYPERGEVLQQIAVYVHATPVHGHPRPDRGEISDAAWWTLDQLDALPIHPGIRARLDAILADPATAALH